MRWKQTSASRKPSEAGCLPSCSAIAAIELEERLRGRISGGKAGQRDLELEARLRKLPQRDVCVSSIIEIESLRLRPMPSFGVLATKMPPPGPRDARIRCELASSLSASRSVGRLTPNSRRQRLLGTEPVAWAEVAPSEVTANLERDLDARVSPFRSRAHQG